MTLQSFDAGNVRDFLEEIAPLLAAYRYRRLRYIAVRRVDEYILLQGLLTLSVRDEPDPLSPFQSSNIICEDVAADGTAYEPEKLIDALVSTGIEIGGRLLSFPADHTDQHHAHYWPFDGSRDNNFNAAGHLVLSSDSSRYLIVQRPDLYRELKANPTPYEGFAKLAIAYGLRFDNGMNYHFDIMTSKVAQVTNISLDYDRSCSIEIWLAGPLIPDSLSVGIRYLRAAGQPARSHAPRTTPNWVKDDTGNWIGTLRLTDVSEDRAVEAIVSYAGFVQDQRASTPLKREINVLQMALDLFRPGTQALSAIIDNRKTNDRTSHALELAVSAALAIRGFRVMTVDKVPGLQDVPDIMACDPNGDVLLVECTLDLPNSDEKLSKLHHKREIVSRGLADANQSEVNIIAVLAVAKTAADLEPFQAQARQHNILMWDREVLDLLARNSSAPNARQFYEELLTQSHSMKLYDSLSTDA